jgi:hypothetical protein
LPLSGDGDGDGDGDGGDGHERSCPKIVLVILKQGNSKHFFLFMKEGKL